MNEDETFAKMKGLNNRLKHKHLIRIKNSSRGLSFEKIEYKHNNIDKVIIDQDAKELLIDCHDYLIPKYFELWHEIKEYKKAP